MEQRDGGDFPPKKPPPPQSEAPSTAQADFPARKLVRQLDFTGFGGGAAASSVENLQLPKMRQPQPQLAKPTQSQTAQLQPPQTLFMAMQQPPQLAASPAQHSIRSLS